MKRETTELAYAKINLMLDIAGVREDGYHLIDGVMQTVSLADRLEVAFQAADATNIRVCVFGAEQPIAQERNLAYRAAELYLQSIVECGTVEISIQKQIPMAAGLAGGSSDAAATLRALNRLFDHRLSVEELCTIGVKLGADVPFCIRGGTMRTEGIGEKLTPCQGLPACWLVVSRPKDVALSTPQMYAALDTIHRGFSEYPGPAPKVEEMLQVLRKGDLLAICPRLENIFEEPAFQISGGRIPALKESLLRKEGALGALMSGSGSAVFCIFQSREQAEKACREVKQEFGAPALVCQPVSKFCVC